MEDLYDRRLIINHKLSLTLRVTFYLMFSLTLRPAASGGILEDSLSRRTLPVEDPLRWKTGRQNLTSSFL